MINRLAEIIEHKKQEVSQRKRHLPLAHFIEQITPSTRSLEQALSSPYADFILECKKASPSKGLIRADFDLDDILSVYQDFASAISVLTDESYFCGSFSYLRRAAQTVRQPILCKDFFIDPYQVYEARFHGADAILLMLSVLDDAHYLRLAQIARSLGLDIVSEVHDEEEMRRALALDARIIGINHRNLRDLSIDLTLSEKLTHFMHQQLMGEPSGYRPLVIAESGVESRRQVLDLAARVDGFLVGSSLMASENLREKCKELIFGRVKICGIKTPEDARTIDQQGGLFAGLVFYPGSKRWISLADAEAVVRAAPLKYVGVFVNHPIEELVSICQHLSLFAVQLHGNEDQEYVLQVRARLPDTAIWQAVGVTPEGLAGLPAPGQVKDRYLLDYAQTPNDAWFGGSGQAFDWSCLAKTSRVDLILAGGVNLDNAARAKQQPVYALDLSSGAESQPGIKDQRLIAKLMTAFRA